MGLAHEVVVAMKEGNTSGAKGLWVRSRYQAEQESQTLSWRELLQPRIAKVRANS